MTDKLTTKDFELEPPVSLRNFIEDQMRDSLDYDLKRGKKVEPITDEVIDELMPRVFRWIEKQALEVFKTNEPWALKAWAFSNILKDTVSSEVNQTMVEELMSPVVEWQDKQPFDPIGYFLKRIKRKSRRTRESYMQTASRFVAREGRKRHYTNEDVEDFQTYAMSRYPNQNSYYQECRRLLQFLRGLPGADKQRELPLGMPDTPKKKDMWRPTASLEEIETLIWACVLDPIPAYMVMRLLCASVYGRRRGELLEFEVNLDGANSWIKFITEKGGEEKPHPLPQSLVPLFAVRNRSVGGVSLQRKLRKICRRAGVYLPPRAGYHWFRRRVSRTVRKTCGSDIDAYRYMRWAEPRGWGMLAWYDEDESAYGQSDAEVLAKHPVVKMWEEALPFILKFNRSYQDCIHNT